MKKAAKDMPSATFKQYGAGGIEPPSAMLSRLVLRA